MSPSEDDRARRPLLARLAPLPLAVLCGLGAFAWLDRILAPPFLSDDGIRDQLLVRDCTELGRCHLIGAITSLAGFHQGAVWLDLLTAVQLAGGDLASARAAVLALLAAGVATTFIVVWRWIRPSMALPTTVALAWMLGLDPNPSSLVNASALAFPAVLTTASLLCYGLSGRGVFLIASAFALGAAINVHLGSVCLTVPFLAIAVLARPRPWLVLLAALAVLAATCLLTSSAALRANAGLLAARGGFAPAIAAATVAVALSALLGARFRRASSSARAAAVGVLVIVPFVVASIWLVFRQKHPFSLPYLYPVAAPAAALTAALLSWPFERAALRWPAMRWIPSGAALVAAALAARAAETAMAGFEPWTFPEAAVVSEAAARRGFRYEDLVFRLQGAECRELLVRMSVAAPAPTAEPRDDRRRLQVVRVRRDAVAAPSEDFVPLDDRSGALLREVDSWLRPEAMRCCRAPLARGAPPVCSDANPADRGLSGERFLFSMRSFPEIHGLDVAPPYAASYEIPLTPGAGGSREVILAGRDARGWRIARVDGARVETPLPAARVRLRSEDGAPGLLVLTRTFGERGFDLDGLDTRYPPCLFEAEPGDPLVALVGAGG